MLVRQAGGTRHRLGIEARPNVRVLAGGSSSAPAIARARKGDGQNSHCRITGREAGVDGAAVSSFRIVSSANLSRPCPEPLRSIEANRRHGSPAALPLRERICFGLPA